MNTVSIPEAAESLLEYLFNASQPTARSFDAISRFCPDETNVDEALDWLVENAYISEENEIFELTRNGLEIAQQVQTQVQRIKRPQGVREAWSPADVPKFDTHPLRTRIAYNREATNLHYLLAFEALQSALPIPVLDGDIAGRLSETNIHLSHDEFISGRHCRFSIQVEDGQEILCVEDLGSRNGTFVNGFRLEQGYLFELEHGSRVQVGETVLIVVRIPY